MSEPGGVNAAALASAPEVTAGGTVLAGEVEFSFTAAGEQLWFRIAVPPDPPADWSFEIYTADATYPTSVASYAYSDNPDEDGDTFTFSDQFDSTDTGFLSFAGGTAATAFVYFGVQLDEPQAATVTIEWATPPSQPHPDLVQGATAVQVTAAVRVPSIYAAVLDPVLAATTVTAHSAAYAARLDPVQGGTRVKLRGRQLADLDGLDGATSVSLATATRGRTPGTLDIVAGTTLVRLIYTPDLSDNPPIELAFDLSGQLSQEVADEGADPFTSIALAPGDHSTRLRGMPTVSTAMPVPVVVNGLPVSPLYAAQLNPIGKLIVGPNHIHASDPAPVWNARTGRYSKPPPGPTMAGRWLVDDLPDPGGGYYWLGDPSGADGTGHYSGARTHWAPHASTPNAPTWHSIFPFKPSVRAYDAYLPDGGVVHHPRGVHFNSHFAEHMWMQFGGAHRQPFTWVIAGLIAGYPTTHYDHHLLDSGRNPAQVHFPRLSAAAAYDTHHINDNLAYRQMLAYSRDGMRMAAHESGSGSRVVRARTYANTAPKMFFGVFNGARSTVGAWGTGGKPTGRGRIANGAAQAHRFYVLGRQYGWIGHDHSSHVLIFEIRFWNYALNPDQLEDQYKQLSSTYHFSAYRRMR